VVKLYDIVPDGRYLPVTDDNKMEYIQKITQVRVLPSLPPSSYLQCSYSDPPSLPS